MDFALYSLAIVVRSDCCVPTGFSNRNTKGAVGLMFRGIRLMQREFVDSMQNRATGFVELFDMGFDKCRNLPTL